MSVEIYRKKLIDLRAAVQREKDNKKRDNEHYADLIKRASSPGTKVAYRKSKIDRSASHDRTIDNLKRQIESTKDALARERERAKRK